MTAALQSLQDQFTWFAKNLPELLDACDDDTTDEDSINSQYAACHANYLNCVNDTFNSDDLQVQALVAQMKQQQTALTDTNNHLGDIAGVITTITTAVKVGVSLAAKM